MIVRIPAKIKSPRKLGINTLDSTHVLGPCGGGHAETHTAKSPQTILSKFKTPYFFHILLRCCLCNSVFISAKVFSGQRLIFSDTLNLLYHLLFFNLCHAFCIVMVVQYVGAIELVVGGYIQHERVTRIEEGVLRPSWPLFPPTRSTTSPCIMVGLVTSKSYQGL